MQRIAQMKPRTNLKTKTTTKQKGRGRPCLLTPEREALLLRAIRRGMPLKQAAMLAGISYDTLNRWRIRGEAADAPAEYRDFCKHLSKAQAVAMERLVGRIQDAAGSDWKAAAWLLERRYPDEFARQQRLEHTGAGGGPIAATVNLSIDEARNHISDADLIALARELVAQEDAKERP